MSAPKDNKNAIGNAGNTKSVVDRKLSAQVRSLALTKIFTILSKARTDMTDKDRELHDAILLKLASNILPRLNEHTGEDGGIIRLGFDKAFNDIKPLEDGTTSETETSGSESSAVQNNKSRKKKRKDKSGSRDDVLQSDSLDEEAETEEDDFSDGA